VAGSRAAAAEQPAKTGWNLFQQKSGPGTTSAVDMLQNLGSLIGRTLATVAADLLSGNETHLLSGNIAEVLSRNRATALSGNSAKVLSENQTPVLSGNTFNLFSNIKVEIHISNNGSPARSPVRPATSAPRASARQPAK
jgi:hypothetical protein